MSDVTQILSAIEAGDRQAAGQLLPLVYAELKRLAAAKLASEKPGQTLQPTALVHEAYMRLVGSGDTPKWQTKGHFFAAAAEAMRRILVDAARRKGSQKRGGGGARQDLDLGTVAAPQDSDDLVALDEALEKLAAIEPEVAELVKLRYFAGFTLDQAAEALGVSPRTADGWWAYARSWLLTALRDEPETSP